MPSQLLDDYTRKANTTSQDGPHIATRSNRRLFQAGQKQQPSVGIRLRLVGVEDRLRVQFQEDWIHQWLCQTILAGQHLTSWHARHGKDHHIYISYIFRLCLCYMLVIETIQIGLSIQSR